MNEKIYGKLGIEINGRDIRKAIKYVNTIINDDYSNLFQTINEFYDKDKILNATKLFETQSESYSLGFEYDINLDELVDGAVNVKDATLYKRIKELITENEENKSLLFTLINIENELQFYLLWSDKYERLLGFGFQTFNNGEEYYYTYFFWNGINSNKKEKNEKIMDITLGYLRDVYEGSAVTNIYNGFEDFIKKNTYNLDYNDKLLYIQGFIDSEYRTNKYDRMLLALIANNNKTINKVTFVKTHLFTNNSIDYSEYAVEKKEDCAFIFRCDSVRDDIMDSKPVMDRLEALLEKYERIFIRLPQPKELKDFLDEKLMVNCNEKRNN